MPTPDNADKVANPTPVSHATRGHATLAGKVLQVFRVGGDSERSVGRHGPPPAEPEQRRTGPVQAQVISDASGPVQARTIGDGATATAAAAHLSEARLGQAAPGAAAESAPVSTEPIRLQTFSINMAERLARTRAAQQDVMRELDKFDESGEDLGKTVDRKP